MLTKLGRNVLRQRISCYYNASTAVVTGSDFEGACYTRLCEHYTERWIFHKLRLAWRNRCGIIQSKLIQIVVIQASV